MKKDAGIALWQPLDVVLVPKEVQAIDKLTAYACQLAPRDITQIVKAFEGGSYEMGSIFVWQKTMSGLKKKLSALGMDFIGEMLDRRDVTANSNAQQVLTDHDALRLAEELGLFPSSHSLRLRHAMEVISHFADPPKDVDAQGMMPEEAVGALRTCIQTVLGHADSEGAIEFAAFRKQLEIRDFKSSDPEVESLISAPYFFQRTTLRVLLAVLKTAQGAQLEHVLANLNTFLPAIWEKLLHPERQSVGWCYAEVHAEGKQTSASGVRAALLKVKGFDYVPETLRSRTFLEAAQKVMDAHQGWNNFASEYAPMQALATLGTTIPGPALSKCMTAIICVRLGNHWGISWNAEPIATQMLSAVSIDRWQYYLDQCLPADDIILGKLTDGVTAQRFTVLVKQCALGKIATTDSNISRLIKQAEAGDAAGVKVTGEVIFNRLRSRQTT